MATKIRNESDTGNEGNEDRKRIASLGDGWIVHLDVNGHPLGKPTKENSRNAPEAEPTKDNSSNTQSTQGGAIEFESQSNGMSADATIMMGIVLAVIALFLWIALQLMAYSPPTDLAQLRSWADQMRILGIATALCVIFAIIAIGVGALKK